MQLKSKKEIIDLVANLEESENFIAFNAHCWFAFSLLYFLYTLHHWTIVITVPLALIISALKEFMFDAQYETNPPQTTKDNIMDFVGYVSGIALAIVAAAIA